MKQVAVIGTVFVDCKGFAKQTYLPTGRNLGKIQFVQGGVGRNVAENLGLLTVPTVFVSTVDDSGLGNEVISNLQSVSVNTDNLLKVSCNGMGMWLAILDHTGNLAGSISQMPDLEHLENLVNQKGESIMSNSSHVALEIDLNENISRKVIELAQKHNRPLFGIPGNLDVVLSHRELLSGMECFICNDIEAGRMLEEDLTGISIQELQEKLVYLAKQDGLKSMVITLGERGSVYFDSISGLLGHQPVFPAEVVDSSGAGDAFFAGTIMGLFRQKPLNEAVIYGSKVASWTIEAAENTCKNLAEWMREEEILSI